LAELETKLAAVTTERDTLRRAYERLLEQHAILKRRIFVAKAERVDAHQLEIEFAETKAALDKLAKELGESPPPAESADGAADDDDTKSRAKPKGRRDLRDIPMPEKRIELLDVALEGKVERIGFEVG
jgi:hypothetical protein